MVIDVLASPVRVVNLSASTRNEQSPADQIRVRHPAMSYRNLGLIGNSSKTTSDLKVPFLYAHTQGAKTPSYASVSS